MATANVSSSNRRWQAVHVSPFGAVGIRTGDGCVEELFFLRAGTREVAPSDALAERACRQIERYIDDPGFRFDLPLRGKGTPFQRSVWRAISAVAPGQTRRYGELAVELGSEARAVGQACGSNPYPLVVPCHRIVAAGGMGGFAHSRGGYLMDIKRWLLGHEATLAPLLRNA